MFEQLFSPKRPRVLARYRSGPLAEEQRRFLVHLADQGVPRPALRSVCRYLRAAIKGLRLADRPHELISCAEVEREGVRWVKRPRKGLKSQVSGRAGKRLVGYVTRWLQFLGRLQPRPIAPPRFATEVAAFADYLLHDKGLAAVTVDCDSKRIGYFLSRLGGKIRTLQDISVEQIDQVFITQVSDGGYARRTLATLASVLRRFFRFAERRSWCRPGLAAAIKAPRLFAHESLPAGPSWEQVQQALVTTEGDRPPDIRDRAMLMLFAVYGLRAAEVRRLRLEDLDWKQELLTIRRSKTRRVQAFPLTRPVGNAILRYLKEVRPRASVREVFLTIGAPFRPLRSNLWRLVAPRLRALGVSLPHHGPHALRHACATHLLARGLSMKEIADHLGHQDTESTRVYAKVDLVGLRQVAEFDLGGVL